METNGGAAPTGCYKCGRPGHWSRDCPSDPNTNPNPNQVKFSSKPASSSHPFKTSSGANGTSFQGHKLPIEKPKKIPKTRPKLTPELLLSDDGLGFVLRHFPKAFKYRGHGHETSDLGNLLNLYSEWHAHLIPYYSFNNFVHKVEQVGASKPVKVTINDLRERVARGGDPTTLLEKPKPDGNSNLEQDTIDVEEPNLHKENTMLKDNRDDPQHDIFQEILESTTEEPSPTLNNETTIADISVQNEMPSQTTNANSIEMSEELKARIEANRLKALERAAARKRALESQAS